MRKYRILIILLLLVLTAGAGTALFLWYQQDQEIKRKQRFYETRQSASFSQTEQELSEIPVEFDRLQKENPDVYAWLTIPGTSIDAPVLQREGDISYYLSHDWTGQESTEGAVCSESQYNGKTFTDVHTVLYGNNCENGALFGGLRVFEDEAFFNEHKLIAVYTPDAIRYYRIFAAYEYDSRHLLESFDCTKPKGLERYVKEIFQQRNLYAHIDDSRTVTEDDYLLTLSTGSSREKGKTYLVQGILEQTFWR
ncbi:MAG: class B sortase [Marvinbryantia sp.]|jgi:sortase B